MRSHQSKVICLDRRSQLSTEEKIKRLFNLLGVRDIVKPGSLVLIKPNFVAPFAHAATSLDLLEAIINEVKQCRADVVIAESSGFEFDTEKTFEILGVYEFTQKNGVRLVNVDNSKLVTLPLQGGFPYPFDA